MTQVNISSSSVAKASENDTFLSSIDAKSPLLVIQALHDSSFVVCKTPSKLQIRNETQTSCMTSDPLFIIIAFPETKQFNLLIFRGRPLELLTMSFGRSSTTSSLFAT